MLADAKAAGLLGASASRRRRRARARPPARRGRGSHRSALAALRAARDVGLRATINTQINRLSWPVLGDILETVAPLGVRGWQIQLTVPMGRAAGAPELLVQPYELLELFPRLAALKHRCDALGIMLWPGNNVGYFGPYETLLRGHNLRGHGGSCGAGKATLGIEANGAIKGCPSLPTDRWTGGRSPRSSTSRRRRSRHVAVCFASPTRAPAFPAACPSATPSRARPCSSSTTSTSPRPRRSARRTPSTSAGVRCRRSPPRGRCPGCCGGGCSRSARSTRRACVEGRALEPVIERLLSSLATGYLHLHFARPGCYAARVDRT